MSVVQKSLSQKELGILHDIQCFHISHGLEVTQDDFIDSLTHSYYVWEHPLYGLYPCKMKNKTEKESVLIQVPGKLIPYVRLLQSFLEETGEIKKIQEGVYRLVVQYIWNYISGNPDIDNPDPEELERRKQVQEQSMKYRSRVLLDRIRSTLYYLEIKMIPFLQWTLKGTWIDLEGKVGDYICEIDIPDLRHADLKRFRELSVATVIDDQKEYDDLGKMITSLVAKHLITTLIPYSTS